MIRFLWRLLTVIPRLILSLLWSLFKSVVILAIAVFVFGHFSSRGGSSDFSENVLTNLDYLVSVVLSKDRAGLTQLADDVAHLMTDDYHHHDGIRWGSNRAKVFIATDNPTLIAAYETAIANWNATGVFTFELVASQEEAYIIVTEYSDSLSQAAGLAETQYRSLTNQLTHVDVMLNTYYLLNPDYGYEFDRIVHTAEHELGHAIGLPHNEDISVMQSMGSHYGIQPADVQAVLELYAD